MSDTPSPGTTPPIDLLAVASAAKHRASEWFRACQHMNSSPAASIAYEAALSEMMLATRDVDRVQSLIFDLYRGELANVR